MPAKGRRRHYSAKAIYTNSAFVAARLGDRRPEKFCGFGYGFAQKKFGLAPSAEKTKALGLALSVGKNSGLGRPEKNELAPSETENRGASPIRQGQGTACKVRPPI